MSILHPTLAALSCAALLGFTPLALAKVAPELKQNAQILHSILQTAFKDTGQARLSALQYSYLQGQGLLFQASSGGWQLFRPGNVVMPVAAVPPAPPVPPLPDADFDFEFEFDSSDVEHVAEAARAYAAEVKEQHRLSYRVHEKQRAIERELRETERKLRDLEFNKSLAKLDKEQQQELQLLQQMAKSLQQKKLEAEKEAQQSRQQLEEQRAKQLAQQQQQTEAMLKMVGEKFSQVLCDYGASLRQLPDNEHITLQLNSRSSDGRYYWVIKKTDIKQCMSGKINAKDLLSKANQYQF